MQFCLCHRVLHHLDALDRRLAVWKSAKLHDTQVIADNISDGRGMHFSPSTFNSLCAPKSFSSLFSSFSFPDIVSLQEFGSLPQSFSMHPLYASFLSLVNHKCLEVAVVIRQDNSYAFHGVCIWADSRGVAVWFSLAATPLLAVGLYLLASGPPEEYEPILQWVPAPIFLSAHYLNVVFGDINPKPRKGTTLSSSLFRYAPSLFDFL